MVEENGTSGGSGAVDPLAGASGSGGGPAHVVAVTSIVQLTLPTQAPSAQVFVLIPLVHIKTQSTISLTTVLPVI